MTRRLAVLLALVALVVLGLVATSAPASRPAIDQEAAEVAAAAKSDPQCVTVRISTKDESYAEVYSAQNPDCTDADGAAVFHNAGGVWKDIYENSGGVGCPREMPEKVAIDFRICSAPSKKVYVNRGEGGLVVKPKLLFTGAHSGISHLRWTGWGTAKAVGHGTFEYGDRYGSYKLKARVTLTMRRACDDNKRTYMHMSVKLLSGTKSQRAGFEGGSRLACPYEG